VFAHVNIWRLNEAGASTDDTAAREIGTRLSQESGFHSYTLIRTGEREVVAVTVFDTQHHLDSATANLAAFVHERLAPLAEAEPLRRGGDVLYHTQA
jgi:heme-degrading monooxygenase HmoA